MAAALPATSASASPPPRLPRSGTLVDRGAILRDAVRALRWTCIGIGKVTGEIDAGEVRVDGTLTVGGAIRTDTLSVDGTLDAGATLDVRDALRTNGMTRLAGALRAGEARVGGTTRVGGPVKVDRLLSIRGSFSAPVVQARAILAQGSLEVEQELSAEEVDATFSGATRIGVLRAPTVRLVLRAPNPVERVLGRDLSVFVDRIESEKVELTGVDVGFVRAGSISLGPDAHVSGYEGAIVQRHRSARVGPESKTPPPHGLTR